MANPRTLLLAPSVALSTTPLVSAVVDITGCGQVAIEIATGTMVGALKVIVELSPDGSAFFADVFADTSGTASSGDLLVPISRKIHTFAVSDKTAKLMVDTRGYSHIRIQSYAATSGSASIWLNKLRLAAN